MAAPLGNEFWKARSKHGRDLIFSSPTVLWEAACEYFEWSDDNPWYINECVKSGPNAGAIIQVPTQRPYTEKGLFIFLDVDRSTWTLYKNREDFIAITIRIEEIIYTQKFEGATVGVFNANIIARDLGLSDKSEVNSIGVVANLTDVSASEIKKYRESFNEKY